MVAFIIVVMCLPVFAAEYRPDFKTKVETAITNGKKLAPSGFNYYVVGYQTVNNYVFVVFSKTPVIHYGDSVRSYSSANNSLTTYTFYNARIVNQYVYAHYGVNNGNPMLSVHYLIPDLSTAEFENLSDYEGYDAHLAYVLSPPPADTSALEALLASALAINNDDYTDSTWNALQSAIAAAQNVLSISGVTQQQVDDAANSLMSTINGLQKNPVDVSGLTSLLDHALSITNIGYTSESWNRLQSAIGIAQELLSGSGFTSEQVMLAKSGLQAAINSLTLVPPEPPPPYEPPEDDLNHRYLVDGVRVSDVLPAQVAMMENLDFAVKNGGILLALLFGVWLVPVLLRRIFSINSESHFISMNEPGSSESFFKSGK